jgi:hypothetical protein
LLVGKALLEPFLPHLLQLLLLLASALQHAVLNLLLVDLHAIFKHLLLLPRRHSSLRHLHLRQTQRLLIRVLCRWLLLPVPSSRIKSAVRCVASVCSR